MIQSAPTFSPELAYPSPDLMHLTPRDPVTLDTPRDPVTTPRDPAPDSMHVTPTRDSTPVYDYDRTAPPSPPRDPTALAPPLSPLALSPSIAFPSPGDDPFEYVLMSDTPPQSPVLFAPLSPIAPRPPSPVPHALLHWYFCRDPYCTIHTDY